MEVSGTQRYFISGPVDLGAFTCHIESMVLDGEHSNYMDLLYKYSIYR